MYQFQVLPSEAGGDSLGASAHLQVLGEYSVHAYKSLSCDIAVTIKHIDFLATFSETPQKTKFEHTCDAASQGDVIANIDPDPSLLVFDIHVILSWTQIGRFGL